MKPIDFDSQIPDKHYFKIGEVSEIAGVPSYVLRFWETEFKKIRPNRTESGQRLYRRQDVELILRIKHLLHEKKFTIEGARQHLRLVDSQKHTRSVLTQIRTELLEIRRILDEPTKK